MTYQVYLIANFSTGFDRELQPWLLPDDAQDTLLDGFVYRGVWEKRTGQLQFATGGRGGEPECESRMIHTTTLSPASGVIDGVNKVFSFTITGSQAPARRGGFRAVENDPDGLRLQLIEDNGTGGTLAGSNGTIDTTPINYTSPSSPFTVTFTTAPAIGNAVLLEVDVYQGLPVMGVMNYYDANGQKHLVVADTTYVNEYNSATNRLDDVSPSYPLTGTRHNFFSWTNYDTPDSNPRLLFVNNKDPIQRFDGTTVTPFPVFTDTGTPVTNAVYNTGDTTVGPYEWLTPVPVLPGSVTIKTGAQTLNDNSFGQFTGDGTGTIDYLTGETTVVFNTVVPAVPDNITIDYTPLIDPIDTALHIFQNQDRLVVLAPTISGRVYGKTILVSGSGRYGDIFTLDASGAGRIDMSDDTFINSADFNRDDLLIFTEGSTWSFKYSGNDAVPFNLNKLDNSRGTLAPHGTISYLNVTTGESPRGFIACDGYSVQRTDDKIPRFSYDDIDLDNFDLCFAGTVDEDRDHYLIYPSTGSGGDLGFSDRILITNYEELNYSIYRIPLSCMGTFFNTRDITWNDLIKYNSWEEMAVDYPTWNSFSYQSKTPIGIGGGHQGQITSLNEAQAEDYPVKIRAITGDSMNLAVTTDFQTFAVGDVIYLTGVMGAVEVTDKQGFIKSVSDNYNFVMQLDINPTFVPSAYTANTGKASKVIKFESKTKKFNPYSSIDKKVRCGWLYLYVSTTNTALTKIDGTPVDAVLRVGVIVNDTERNTTLSEPQPNQNYYEVNLTSHQNENGIKKWYKVWINQTGRFIQFDVSNQQAGADIKIHAMMPGFAPVGRLV